jgi:hypothetical protein
MKSVSYCYAIIKLNVGSVIDSGVELELDSGFEEKSNASVTRCA